SGSGPALPLDGSRPLLGAAGDMYGTLSKSLMQMKNVLASIGDLLAGDEDDVPLSKRLANFDLFTGRLDQMIGTLETKMPEQWDTAEQRIEEGRQRVEAIKTALTNVQPELKGGLERAEQSIQDFRKKLGDLAEAAREKFKSLREDSRTQLAELSKMVKEYKERAPTQVRQAREWTEQISGKVEQIDRWMTDSDRSMTQGFESIRQTLEGLRVVADGMEEKTWYLSRHPWTLT